MESKPGEDGQSSQVRLSRRRLVQHVAWTTPVILLATAAPAAAASGAGTLRITGFTAGATHSGGPNRYVTGHGALACGSGDPEITGLVLRFGFASSLVGSQVPQLLSGAGWQFDTETLAGGLRYFTYRWTGTPLSGSSTTTTAASVRVHAIGHGSFSTTVHVDASGFTLGSPVSALEQSFHVTSS